MLFLIIVFKETKHTDLSLMSQDYFIDVKYFHVSREFLNLALD